MDQLLLDTINKLRETLDSYDGSYGENASEADRAFNKQLANRFLTVTRHTQGQQIVPCILIRIPMPDENTGVVTRPVVSKEDGKKKVKTPPSRSKVCSYRGSLSPVEMRAFVRNARLDRDEMFKNAYKVSEFSFENLRSFGFRIGSQTDKTTEEQQNTEA
ncbi:hypothetical protein [Vibrio sp. D431a]|uniref:hypothetical protein n=1 Tax=Vibrio sp. D431a TaxID=2837388 RepID=UPI0025524CFA|nr:hypothetical protein [Vibrio sp. D431a]MDK9793266.1 hypothetical protein [Vibrio sp. D431a]